MSKDKPELIIDGNYIPYVPNNLEFDLPSPDPVEITIPFTKKEFDKIKTGDILTLKTKVRGMHLNIIMKLEG